MNADAQSRKDHSVRIATISAVAAVLAAGLGALGGMKFGSDDAPDKPAGVVAAATSKPPDPFVKITLPKEGALAPLCAPISGTVRMAQGQALVVGTKKHDTWFWDTDAKVDADGEGWTFIASLGGTSDVDNIAYPIKAVVMDAVDVEAFKATQQDDFPGRLFWSSKPLPPRILAYDDLVLNRRTPGKDLDCIGK